MCQAMLRVASRLSGSPALLLEVFLFSAAVGGIATKPGADVNWGDLGDSPPAPALAALLPERSLAAGCTAQPVKEFFLISNLNVPWHDPRPFP